MVTATSLPPRSVRCSTHIQGIFGAPARRQLLSVQKLKALRFTPGGGVTTETLKKGWYGMVIQVRPFHQSSLHAFTFIIHLPIRRIWSPRNMLHATHRGTHGGTHGGTLSIRCAMYGRVPRPTSWVPQSSLAGMGLCPASRRKKGSLF